MKNFRSLVHWLPFAFAAYLCYTTLWRLSTSETAAWGPAFYAFLPLCFLFCGMVTFRLEREIRELRREIAGLHKPQATERPAAGLELPASPAP